MVKFPYLCVTTTYHYTLCWFAPKGQYGAMETMKKRTSKLKLWMLCMFTCTVSLSLPLGAQEISVRTNLAVDALSEPNLGVEFQTGEHWSVGVDGGLKAWPRWLAWDWDQNNETHWRNYYVSPEVRYYAGQVFRGFFAGADALYTHYNIGRVSAPFSIFPDIENNRLQGSFWGGGLLVGYAWWPWQHWRLEVSAGAVAGLAAYDRYDCPHCGTKLSEDRKAAVVPKLAVNLAWNPVSRNKHEERRQARIFSGRDTITVLAPPVAFVVQLGAVKAPQTPADRLAQSNDWVIPIEKYRSLDFLTRPGRDSVMYVTFGLDSHVLNRDFGNNAAVLDRLQGAIETIRDAGTTDELLISIVGLASIEGPQRRNDTLSVRRARAVADYLTEKTFVDRSRFEVIGKGEAWDWFKAQLEASPEGNERLLDIIRTEPDADVRESLIKEDPALYSYVKERFLSDQRNSGYIRIYYSNRPDEATQKWNGAVAGLLRSGNYADAVRMIERDKTLLSRVEADAEATNAYGMALYMKALDEKDEALEARAVELVEEAARRGSEAAVQNLKGIEVYGPARKEFEAWKEIMK